MFNKKSEKMVEEGDFCSACGTSYFVEGKPLRYNHVDSKIDEYKIESLAESMEVAGLSLFELDDFILAYSKYKSEPHAGEEWEEAKRRINKMSHTVCRIHDSSKDPRLRVAAHAYGEMVSDFGRELTQCTKEKLKEAERLEARLIEDRTELEENCGIGKQVGVALFGSAGTGGAIIQTIEAYVPDMPDYIKIPVCAIVPPLGGLVSVLALRKYYKSKKDEIYKKYNSEKNKINNTDIPGLEHDVCATALDELLGAISKPVKRKRLKEATSN